MNSASKNKLLIWCVVLLMIVNVAVIATIWLQHQKESVQPKKIIPGDFLIRELGLDKKQQEQFQGLRKEHQQQSVKTRGEIKNARDNFYKLLQKPTVNDSSKKSASAEIAKHLQEMDLITFDHFKKVRDMCTPDQQKRFDEIIEDVLRMMSGPPPPQNGKHPPNGNPQQSDRPPPPDN